MPLGQLREARRFFAANDHEIDSVVTLTFRNMFALHPASVELFSDDVERHVPVFSAILRKLIETTRTCHLWPVSAQTGNAALPGLESIRLQHEHIGVTRLHFSIMKTAILQAMEQTFGAEFTPDIRIAFVFIFDVLAKSLTDMPDELTELGPLSKFSGIELDDNAPRIALSDIMGDSREMM